MIINTINIDQEGVVFQEDDSGMPCFNSSCFVSNKWHSEEEQSSCWNAGTMRFIWLIHRHWLG